MDRYPLIRKIYLYLFALIGLILMVIAGVQLADLGLKVYVFKQIERQETYYQKMPPCGTIAAKKLAVLSTATSAVQLTEDERIQIKSWLESYKTWQEEQKSYDPIAASRQRTASTAIAMLIVGLPLYFYHWRVIKKETKEQPPLASK